MKNYRYSSRSSTRSMLIVTAKAEYCITVYRRVDELSMMTERSIATLARESATMAEFRDGLKYYEARIAWRRALTPVAKDNVATLETGHTHVAGKAVA